MSWYDIFASVSRKQEETKPIFRCAFRLCFRKGTSLENRLVFSIGVLRFLVQLNTQGYRSGHNEAVLKTVWGNPRGFESHSLRQKQSSTFVGLCFSLWTWVRPHAPLRSNGLRLALARRCGCQAQRGSNPTPCARKNIPWIFSPKN